MKRSLFVSQLTALPLNPPQLLQAAADAGADGIGVRLLPVAPGGLAYRLMDDPALLSETLAVKAATGLRVVDLEIIRIGTAFDVHACKAFLDTGAALGAAHVLVAGDDPDEARTIVSFARLCEVLRPYGLTADLEFMPWTEVRDAAAARRIVEAAAQPNGAVLVDTLHFARSNSRLDDLEALPRIHLNYAQLCDGPAAAPATVDGLIHAARCERGLPGEGGLDLAAILARLPGDLPIGVETPSDARAAQFGHAEWVRRSVVAARAWLAAAEERSRA
jgi:sugar phosphate isomerase/epimerase